MTRYICTVQRLEINPALSKGNDASIDQLSPFQQEIEDLEHRIRKLQVENSILKDSLDRVCTHQGILINHDNATTICQKRLNELNETKRREKPRGQFILSRDLNHLIV